MKRTLILSIAVLVCISSFVSAELIRDGIDIDFVTIGNAGNAGDTRAEANPSGRGAIDYNYRIGKYEITNTQWNVFISAAGAPTGNPSDAYDEGNPRENNDLPITEVSWYEVIQFCNYLTSGDKSKGAYQFSGINTNPGDFLGIDRNSAFSTYGIAYVIPTEDEWYKAAYHKPGGGYSLYANGTNTAPIPNVETNYDDPTGNPWEVDLIPVNGTMEQNGTFDMMGNVFEWNETQKGQLRGALGGSYENISLYLSSLRRDFGGPEYEGMSGGFRVASVPEPATILLLTLGGLALLRKRRA